MFETLLRIFSPSRSFNLISAFAGIFAMAYAYYLQFVEYLVPCPLCIFDRVFLLGIIITLFVASIHNPQRTGQRIYACIAMLFTAGGLTSSGRHVWLQHLPADQVPECGPGLNYLLDTFPLGQVLDMVFRGSGECAEISWQFLGFSLAEATLVIFCIYFLFLLFQIFRSKDTAFEIKFT